LFIAGFAKFGWLVFIAGFAKFAGVVEGGFFDFLMG